MAGRLLGSLDTSTNTTGFYLTDALGSVLASFSNTDKSAAIAGKQVRKHQANSQKNKPVQ